MSLHTRSFSNRNQSTPTIKMAIAFALLHFVVGALAQSGPTSLGKVEIGMSMASFKAAIALSPVDCASFIDTDGKLKRSEIKYLRKDQKTLCWPLVLRSPRFNKSGSIENIQIGGLSYDVIEGSDASSNLIKEVGDASKAIFIGDRLVSLEIYSPKVTLEILTSKYGPPIVLNGMRVESCRNRIGAEFKNDVGKLDLVWTNGDVNAILRTVKLPPRDTCTEDNTYQYYILQKSEQIKAIEDAIEGANEKQRGELMRESVKDSKF